MGIIFRPKTTTSLAQERKLKALIHAQEIKSTDSTKFEGLCEKFREVCKQIRDITDLKQFRGSYDECEAAMNADVFLDSEAQMLYNKLNILNSACKYESEKLGYKFAEWWTHCWQDELAFASKTVAKTR